MGERQWVKSANGRGIVEVWSLMHAFEEINLVKLEVAFTCEEVRGRPELVGKITAWEKRSGEVDRTILGSRSVTCSDINLQTIESAAIHLMYMMDAYLASCELYVDPPK